MALEIGTTKGHAKKISILVWGEPGIGKTTLAKTLPVENDERVLYVAVDPGQLALRDRGFTSVKVTGDKFLREIYNYVKENEDKYDWVFFDGLNEAGETVLRAERKIEAQKAAASGKDPNHWAPYNKLDDQFCEWVWAMLALKPNMVFVTHRDFDPKRDRSYLPLFPGQKFPDRLIGIFDEVGYMRLLPGEKGAGKRVIQFSPEFDPRCEVKDRSGALNSIEDPDLGKIMAKIYKGDK